jgi:hypothetical protein
MSGFRGGFAAYMIVRDSDDKEEGGFFFASFSFLLVDVATRILPLGIQSVASVVGSATLGIKKPANIL